MTATLESISRPLSETKNHVVNTTNLKISTIAQYLMDLLKPKKKGAKHSSIFSGAKSLDNSLSKRRSKPAANYITTDQVARRKLSSVGKPTLSLHELVSGKVKPEQKETFTESKIKFASIYDPSLYSSKARSLSSTKSNHLETSSADQTTDAKKVFQKNLPIELAEALLEKASKKNKTLFAKMDHLIALNSKEMILDAKAELDPIKEVKNGPKISSADLLIIEELADSMHSHNHAELDQIVERADIYFAIQFLVKDLIIQSEEQAREVLRSIKDRKKNIDALGDLSGIFILAKGDIDYSKDGHTRALIDCAIAAGVPLTPGKYDFTQAERDDLMKIIDSKKTSIESFNQTEMVTLQEKQSRFNSLQEMLTHLMKQLEHVIRTIVGNVRPG